ncbi:hypothetical protein PAPHI01_2290 [Pancytospora philotis]|nr:hypothetical protein PAPHI01_2290 [Pancytospora philotis]
MLAGVLPLLYYGGVCGKGSTSAPRITMQECAYFAELGVAGLSVLEDKVLDSVYKRCSQYDSPEIGRGVLDSGLPNADTEDKARYVVLSVLEKAGQPVLFAWLLGKFGYAGCLLLRKLFSDLFIESLFKLPAASDDSALRQEFRRTEARCRYALDGIYQFLEWRVVTDGRKGLLQLAENRNGQDLAIYTLKAMFREKTMTLSSAFTELVNSWADDANRRRLLLPAVVEYIQFVLELNFCRHTKQTELRDSIVRHVHKSCDTTRECFELLYGFSSLRLRSATVNKYICVELDGDISLSFVRKYLAYIQTMPNTFSNVSSGVYNFFQALLPPVANFHNDENSKWRSDPERFRLISPRWLREMFEDLRDNAVHEGRRSELMRKYMAMVDDEVFSAIMFPLKREERPKLADFMLEHRLGTTIENKYKVA